MKNIKIKPPMEKPKTLEKVNIPHREAGAVMKEKYISRTLKTKPESSTASNAAVNDATQSVKSNAQSAAIYTAYAVRKSGAQISNKVNGKHSDASGQTIPQGETSQRLKNIPTRMEEAHSPSNYLNTDAQIEQAKQKLRHIRIKQRPEDTRLRHATERKNNFELQTGSAIRQRSSAISRPAAPQPIENKTFQKNTAFNRTHKSAQQRAKEHAIRKMQRELAGQPAHAAGIITKQTTTSIKRMALSTAKAFSALMKGLLAVLGGVGSLIAVITVIAATAAVIASPFGLFFSGEDRHNPDAVPVSSVAGHLNMEFSNKLEQIQNSVTHDIVEIHGNPAGWAEILAVFAVKTAGGDAAIMDVVTIDNARADLIKAVFWDMNGLRHSVQTVTSGSGENATTTVILHIYIDSKTHADMIAAYNFNPQQEEALNGMLMYRDMLLALAGNVEISSKDALALIENLPPDLPARREAVIKAACSLVGKVNYFWGGKSTAIGWDSRWGTLKEVTAAGNSTTGTMRLFGLDCSGFVTWAFINAGFDASAIGHGVSNQSAKAASIPWNEAQPGDLAVYADLSHIGIIAGRGGSGNLLVVHCAAGQNNVVITGTGGFGFAARPAAYD